LASSSKRLKIKSQWFQLVYGLIATPIIKGQQRNTQKQKLPTYIMMLMLKANPCRLLCVLNLWFPPH